MILDKLAGIVAPLVGAWIESYMNLFLLKQKQVAPLVGAWIESI